MNFRKELSGFFLSSRLYSDDVLYAEHKSHKIILFETWLGVPPIPYRCVVFYCRCSDSSEPEIYLWSGSFLKSDASRFYNKNIVFLGGKDISKILDVAGLRRMQFHRNPIWLEKNSKGTLIIFNENVPGIEFLENLYKYLELTDFPKK